MSERSESKGKVIKYMVTAMWIFLYISLLSVAHVTPIAVWHGDQSEKVFHLKSAIDLKVGDLVKVIIDNVEIRRSAFVAYIIPIVLVVCAALILEKLHVKDIKIGLTSILIIALYFLGLNLFMKKKESKIKIEKIT